MLRIRKQDFIQKISSQFNYLVTGSGGQIGRSLIPLLIKMVGKDHLVSTDVGSKGSLTGERYEQLDVTNKSQYEHLIKKYNINYIIHLAGILSALGEKKPEAALNVNCNGVVNALEMAKAYKAKIFIPSTIGVFGPDVDQNNVQNASILNPKTMYGVTKVFMENIGNYYYHKYQVDFRCLRVPTVISPVEFEAQGTAGYSSGIYFQALKKNPYILCISKQRKLPYVYLDDVLEGIIKIIHKDRKCLSTNVYNIQGLSFTPGEIVEEIKRRIPDFICTYVPDFRDKIAKDWPYVLDDSLARKDWGWSPKCRNVRVLSDLMIEAIKKNLKL